MDDDKCFGLTPTQLNLAFFVAVGAVALAAFVYFGGVGAVKEYVGEEQVAVVETGTPTPAPTEVPAAVPAQEQEEEPAAESDPPPPPPPVEEPPAPAPTDKATPETGALATGIIAFLSYRDGNGEIYVVNADGSGLTRLTDHTEFDGSAAWSPGGSRIAFYSYRDGNGDIYVVNADGSGLTRITNNPANDFAPAWSPLP